MQNETSAGGEAVEAAQSEPNRPSRLNIFKRLKGRSRAETLENYSIGGVLFGALVLSVGIGLTVIDPVGMSAITAMMGALLSFVSTVSFIVALLLKELFSKE